MLGIGSVNCHELESLILTGSIRLEEFARELKHSDRRASYMCHGPTLVPTLIRHSGSQQQSIIRELACTGLIPDQRFNQQLVPSGPARRNSGNARIKTSGVARHINIK